MRKKIYLFTDNFPYGNSETFLETELPYLAEHFDVTLIPLFISGEKREIPVGVNVASPLLAFSPKEKKKLTLSGVFNLSPLFFSIPEFINRKVAFNKNRIWIFFTSLLLFRSIYPKINIEFTDSDMLYFYWANKSAILAPFLKKKFHCKTVVRFHGSDIYESAKGYIPFRKLLFNSIDLACPISEHGKKYLETEYENFAPKNIIVSRLGVLHHGENPENTSKVFQLVSCSSLIPLKRIEMIAAALQKIEFRVKWTHIGSGPNLENIRKEIKKLPPNIEVDLKGTMPNKEIMTLYETQPFDLFINVSESEGIPVSIMEALSFGIPVMATNVGGVSEIADENVGKLLDKNITISELKNEIELFYHFPEKKNFRKEALKKWNEMYNADQNYRKFVKLLSEL